MDAKKHYIFFLDESGTHNYEDKESTIFGLCGCIFNLEYYQSVVEKSFSDFKVRQFGDSNIILHYADYVRNRKEFAGLKNPAKRHGFYKALNQYLDELQFTIIACRMNKPWHWQKYGPLAHDPYHYALECIVERFTFFLNENRATGTIIAESRTTDKGTNSLDGLLEIVFLELKLQGTYYVKSSTIRERITGGLIIRKKSENVAGLQIVDTVVTPIVRRKTIDMVLLQKRERDFDALDYSIIEKKYRRASGRFMGIGLIDLPKKEN